MTTGFTMISESLAQTTAKKDEDRHRIKRSAVAVVLDGDSVETASMLMIQRAKHDSDPWSGHMAFPGGRQESVDASAVETAKREMREEVGLDIDRVNSDKSAAGLIGRLSDINLSHRSIRFPMVVTPYVFRVDQRPALLANREVADVAWIPLSFFADPSNRENRVMVPERSSTPMPCYEFSREQVVWGMSLVMIEDLLSVLGFKFPSWY